jgi:hypothetical protein
MTEREKMSNICTYALCDWISRHNNEEPKANSKNPLECLLAWHLKKGRKENQNGKN